jgi:hypothetical protein
MSWLCKVVGHAWRKPALRSGVARYCKRCQALTLTVWPPAPEVSETRLRTRYARPVVYVAHPLGQGDDRELNRTNAAQWCAYLAELHGIAPCAPWIVISGVWDESKRAAGMDINLATIERCDELWLVGGCITEGMAIEAAHARACGITVRDMTGLGYLPPLDGSAFAPKGAR